MKHLVGNPVHNYCIIDRVVNLLPVTVRDMRDELVAHIVRDTISTLPNVTTDDVAHAGLNIARIGYIYKYLANSRLSITQHV